MCETFTAPSWLTPEEDDAAAAKVLRAYDDDDDEGLAVSLRAEYAHAVDKHKRIFGLFVGKKRREDRAFKAKIRVQVPSNL
jgi:hypothetical protein